MSDLVSLSTGLKQPEDILSFAGDLFKDQPVGVASFWWLDACIPIAVSCTRKIRVLLSRSRVCPASSIFLRLMRLHGFPVLGLIRQHITQTLRLTHIVHHLHGCVFLLLLFCLSGSVKQIILFY